MSVLSMAYDSLPEELSFITAFIEQENGKSLCDDDLWEKVRDIGFSQFDGMPDWVGVTTMTIYSSFNEAVENFIATRYNDEIQYFEENKIPFDCQEISETITSQVLKDNGEISLLDEDFPIVDGMTVEIQQKKMSDVVKNAIVDYLDPMIEDLLPTKDIQNVHQHSPKP